MKRKPVAHLPQLAQASQRQSIFSLGRALVRLGVISEAEVSALSASAETIPGRFAGALIAKGVMEGPQLAQFISQTFGYPLIALDALEIGKLPIAAVPERLMRSGLCIGLGQHGTRLTLAMADPSDTALLNDLRGLTGLSTDPVVANLGSLSVIVAQALESSKPPPSP